MMKGIKLTSRDLIRLLSLITIPLLAFLTEGCGAIIYSSEQELKVQPTGAKLEVYSWDGHLVDSSQNESSFKVKVHRPINPSYLVRLQKEGYCPRYWLTNHEYSGPLVFFDRIMGFTSLPFGFLIFSAPYAITKNAWAFIPNEFNLTTPETETCGP